MTKPRVALKVAGAAAPAGHPASAEPCTLVIFGATGDLSRRKLLPSLFHLTGDGRLDDVRIIGVGRTDLGDDGFRKAVKDALREFGPSKTLNARTWKAFAARVFYVSGNLDDPGTYQRIGQRIDELARRLPGRSGRLFYFAIPPSLYPDVAARLQSSGIAPKSGDAAQRPWVRLVIEKPFGRDKASARALNEQLKKGFAEHQLYRIDHYLGKETVQNLLVLRFANTTFESLWNSRHIEQVQITAAETVGVEHRAGYYEEAGVVRDMFQNHLLQLLALTAMEAPARLGADQVRDEKLKVLRAIVPVGEGGWHDAAVRGQYGPGTVGRKKAPGYRAEPDVAPDSRTPTYAALRLSVDNPRWQGVPFYLRSGKRLEAHASEIAVLFRRGAHRLFQLPDEHAMERNVLAVGIQPREAIVLRFEVKVPGSGFDMASADMDFEYQDAFKGVRHDAYETLLLDAMCGDATLFTRHDEVEAAWDVVDPLIKHWENTPAPHFPNYAAGTWGPQVADDFIARSGLRWRELSG